MISVRVYPNSTEHVLRVINSIIPWQCLPSGARVYPNFIKHVLHVITSKIPWQCLPSGARVYPNGQMHLKYILIINTYWFEIKLCLIRTFVASELWVLSLSLDR